MHSALLYPLDAQGRLQGDGDAYAQATHVLGSLDTALRAAGTGLDRLARLHVYVADASVTCGDRSTARRAFHHRRSGRDHRRVANAARRRPRRDGCRGGDGAPQGRRRRRSGLSSPDFGRLPVTGHTSRCSPRGPSSSSRAARPLASSRRRSARRWSSCAATCGPSAWSWVMSCRSRRSWATWRAPNNCSASSPARSREPRLHRWSPSGATRRCPSRSNSWRRRRARQVAANGWRSSSPSWAGTAAWRGSLPADPIFVSGLTGASADPAVQVREVFGELQKNPRGRRQRHAPPCESHVLRVRQGSRPGDQCDPPIHLRRRASAGGVEDLGAGHGPSGEGHGHRHDCRDDRH